MDLEGEQNVEETEVYEADKYLDNSMDIVLVCKFAQWFAPFIYWIPFMNGERINLSRNLIEIFPAYFQMHTTINQP